MIDMEFNPQLEDQQREADEIINDEMEFQIMEKLQIGVEYYLDNKEYNTGFFVKYGIDKGRDVIWFEQGTGTFYEKSPNGLIGFPAELRKYKKVKS